MQLVFYFLWGNLLSSWSLIFAAIQSETRPAGAQPPPCCLPLDCQARMARNFGASSEGSAGTAEH